MKKETGKKSKLWLWILIAVVVVVAAAVVTVLLLLNGNSTGGTDATTTTPTTVPVEGENVTPESEVYWNLDKVEFTQDSETGLSTREKADDGLYHIRFASQGELIELTTADKQIVNFIDTMDAMGLVLDADNTIIDVLEVKSIAVETAKSFYVKIINGNSVTLNSSIAMNGMDIMIELTDDTYIMDVRPGSETLGQPIELDVMDMVSVYGSEEVPAEAIYVTHRPESSPLYMRVDRFYDSATAMTTRVPDANGIYTIPFAKGGEILQLKCKDVNIVTAIDLGTDAKQVMGLTFDEEGYITGTILAATAIRGKIACQVYHVDSIEGTTVTATRIMSGNEQGRSVTFNLTEDTEIIMNENGCCEFIGKRVPDLQIYDRVVVWTDMQNNAVFIKIDRRKVDAPMYYLQARKYDSATLQTARVPDASGYYVFELACNGKMVTCKTKDKALATKLDANTWQFFGLRVEKGIIKEYFDANCVSGGYGIGGQRFVTQNLGTIVRIVSGTDFNSGGNYMLDDNTEIYDMTGDPGTKLGSKTTLQEYDRVICNRTPDNILTHVYVLDRYRSGCKIYYNSSRQYNSTTLETTRKPDADGYYVYTMYVDGKQVEVKTKSKDIATVIDAQNAPIVAMKVSDGIVKAAYPAISGIKLAAKVFNYNYVGEITSDKVVSCYYFSNGEKIDASASYKMASDCKVYNVSTIYNNHRGEKSSIKKGDRIQALRNIETGELTHIWIISRSIDSPLYINPARKYDSTNKVTTRIPNADGYYEVELFVDGQMKVFKTKDKELMSLVDSYGTESPFAMQTKGNIIERVDAIGSSKLAINTKVSFQDITKISGKTITTERKRPGQSNTGATVTFTYTSKTKVYDVSYYSKNQYKTAKLKVGDRVSVYADLNGEITYILVWYPQLHEDGYMSKCHHCNKNVWWEPYTGSFIGTAGDEVVHYYQPADFTRGQGSVGANANSSTTPHYTAVFDLNGKTFTSTGRNFLVYADLIVIDTVGGGILEANGYQGGSGGNFLISGGSVTICDGVTLRQNNAPEAKASNGGNFTVNNLNITATGKSNVGKVILKDAKLEAWDCVNGGNILLNAGTQLTINKATVTGGDIKVSESAVVKLDGKVNIGGEGIDLTSGAKIAESKLTAGSKVVVQAFGIFTEKLANADAQAAFYESERKFYPVVVKDSALWTDRDPSQPDYVTEPEIPAKPDVSKVDNTALALDANSQAKCPVCNVVVTWTAITDTTKSQELGNNGHYYLPADVLFEAADLPYIRVLADQKACLHLNDHNLTATKSMAVLANGELSIMGNGTVSGNGYADASLVSTGRPDLHAATVEANGQKAVINLYGGTYIKSAENDDRVANITKNGETAEGPAANHTVEVHGNGGTINMYEGAVIDARNTKKNAVMSYWGMFNLYGGTVYGGSAVAVTGGNWTTTKSGNISIYGGLVQAGTSGAVSGSGLVDGPASLSFYGGEIKGNVSYNANTKVVLAGNPVLSRLTMPSNKVGAYEGKVILGELTEGAYIPVTGTEEISFQSENAAEYVKYFHSLTDVAIVHQNFAVSFYYVPDPELPELPEVMPTVTEDLKFIGESTWAICPLCEEYVKWTPITNASNGSTQLNSGSGLPGDSHYYLAEDVTYTGSSVFMNAPGTGAAKHACFHLNGHNFTATNANVAHGSYGTLNFMGTGVVSGNGKSGATITINTNKFDGGGIFLYSGTYTKASGNKTGVVQINSNGGLINVMKDAKIVAPKNSVAAYLNGGGHIDGQLIISGTVEGGYVQGVDAATSASGAATNNIFILDGGNVEGLKLAKTNMIGLRGEAVVGATGLDLTSGAKISASALTGSAMIPVKASGAFTDILDNANEQKAFYTNAAGYLPVELKAGALWTDVDPDTPVVPEIPEAPSIPAKPALLKVDNSNLVLSADSKAVCPVCGTEVEWIAIDDASAPFVMASGKHYYLATDLTYEGTSTFLSREETNKVSCLHLNGHNITTPNGLTIYAGAPLNIMGNGTVCGNGTAEGRGATLNTNSSIGKINIYGGTWTKVATNEKNAIINIFSNDATINIFEGVKVDGSAVKGNTVNATAGYINIYGGELLGGLNNHVVNAATYYNTALKKTFVGTVNIFGGLIKAQSGYSLGAYGSGEYRPAMNIYGGEIRGNYTVRTSADTIIAGNPIMNMLQVEDGALVQLGDMTEGASITVRANGVFTTMHADAATYVEKAYFVAAADYKAITVETFALATSKDETDEPVTPPVTPEEPEEPETPEGPVIPEKPELLQVDNSNITLDSASQAECPVCKKTVTWIAITDTTAVQKLEGGKHYILTADLTHEADGQPYIQAMDATAACLHLNGHNITATNAMAILVNGKLNIMGNGTVSGNGYSDAAGASLPNLQAATIQTNNASAVLNLYGGTYIKSDANDGRTANSKVCYNHIVGIHGNGGTINMFEGVTVDATNYKSHAVRAFFGMFNMYGGLIKGSSLADNQAAVSAGNWSKTNSGSAQIFGGTIIGNKNTGVLGSATATAPSFLGIYGGDINSAYMNEHVETVIAGNPVLKVMTVSNVKTGANGGKFTLGELTDGAKIPFNGTGVISNPNENAATYLEKGYILAKDSAMELVVVDNALVLQEKVVEPEQPAKFDNSNLTLSADNKAMCPACGEEVVWTAVTQATHGENPIGELTVNSHFYLAEDITYTGTANFVRAPSTDKVACLHLNGHNLTATKAKVVMGYAGVINVMGNGVVTGGYESDSQGAAVHINTNGPKGAVNLYGGTYTKLPSCKLASIIAIWGNGGIINIYEDVKVVGYSGGPGIYVGTSSLKDSELTIKGATLEGANLRINAPKALTTGTDGKTSGGNATKILLDGAKIYEVNQAKGAELTLTGDVVIERLQVYSGAKFTVGELTSGAKINLWKGNGTISEVNDKMSTYFGSFTSSYGCELSVSGNALVARDVSGIDNKALTLDAENKAKCPVCNETVTWTAITEIADTGLVLTGNAHYYLANDITYEGTENIAIKYPYSAEFSKKTTCLHLNGHNLTATNQIAIFAGNYLNIMGQGIVSGNYTKQELRAATLEVNSSVAKLNLYGGTFVKPATNTVNPIVSMNTAGGIINMYDGATIDGTDLVTEKYPTSVHMQGRLKSDTQTAIVVTFNMYGGTIKNGTNNTGNGGNIRILNNGVFNMYGGTLTGGKAPAGYGGNIYSSGGPINILGGTVTGGLARIGGNVASANHPVVIKDATISDGVADLTSTGSASHGGNVSVDRSTLYIGGSAKILNGIASKGHAGNVRCYNTVLTMDGGRIENGTSKFNNGNIWVYCDKADLETMDAYFNGGVSVTASGELVTAAGNGLQVSNQIKAYIGGGFTVVDPEGAAFKGVTVATSKAAEIIEAADWFGSLNK